MKILGVTGGIATGKTIVTRMLAEEGAPTVSADAIAHSLLAPGTETTQAGSHDLPGLRRSHRGEAIDRRALGRLIFANPAARVRLEALTHPAIIAALRSHISEWRNPGPGIAAAEIPLLFEADLERLVDAVVVAACGESDRKIARLCERLGIDETESAVSGRGAVAAHRKNRSRGCGHYHRQRFERHTPTGAGVLEFAMTHQGFTLWMTGLSGSGKSNAHRGAGPPGSANAAIGVELLDGDEVRTHLSKGLTFSKEDRDINVRRIGYVARLLARNGVITLTAAISPYQDVRGEVRAEHEADGIPFVEVYAEATLAALSERDVKGPLQKGPGRRNPPFYRRFRPLRAALSSGNRRSYRPGHGRAVAGADFGRIGTAGVD